MMVQFVLSCTRKKCA